jgi:LasA protease
MKRKSRLFFLLIWLWAFPALACNFPRPTQSAPYTAPEELRQTLQATQVTASRDSTATAMVSGTVAPTYSATLVPTSTVPVGLVDGVYTYAAQSGDTLTAVAARFGIDAEQIIAQENLDEAGYLPQGQILQIPWTLDVALPSDPLLPDGEVINSPTALDFNLEQYIASAGGYLSVYTETLDSEVISGIEIVRRISDQASINPRLLLAFLEYRSGWVRGYPTSLSDKNYPLGFYAPGQRGLYRELQMTATQLNLGYYGWRLGNRLTLKFPDQRIYRMHPALNPGSAALQQLFSKFYRRDDWQEVLYSPGGFIDLYQQMFGDFHQRDATLGALIPAGLSQPVLELPFVPGERWSLTGGPHASWDSGTPRGALDFSPVTGEAVCAISSRWSTAVAPGVVARSGRNMVVLDLDGDGTEQTGWVLVYYHLAQDGLILAGTQVALDDSLGHPSCEGGRATGKHVHIARKYNGEWLAADGPLPFVLSGWRAVADARNYQGSLINGDRVVYSNPGGSQTSVLQR